MDTERDMYIAWLEVQMEIEELEKDFIRELRGMKNGERNKSRDRRRRGREGDELLRGERGGIL